MKAFAILTCILCMFAFAHIALAQDDTNTNTNSNSNTNNAANQAASPDNGNSQVSGNNAQIASLLMRKLHDEGINSDGIKVQSQAGKVTLSGHLKNKADLSKIVAVTRSLPGVTSVETKFTDDEKK